MKVMNFSQLFIGWLSQWTVAGQSNSVNFNTAVSLAVGGTSVKSFGKFSISSSRTQVSKLRTWTVMRFGVPAILPPVFCLIFIQIYFFLLYNSVLQVVPRGRGTTCTFLFSVVILNVLVCLTLRAGTYSGTAYAVPFCLWSVGCLVAFNVGVDRSPQNCCFACFRAFWKTF